LLQKNNVKVVDTESVFFESQLSVFSAKPGEVTLAGEGGKLVGRKDYWESVLLHFQKQTSIDVHSIYWRSIGLRCISHLRSFKNRGI
jgi:hypothetical protein